MKNTHSKKVVISLVAGVALTSVAAVLMGQGANQPARSEPQYFVTADGEGAHLWVREGTTLRVVGHGECKECATKGHDDHKDGDGHDHDKPAKK